MLHIELTKWADCLIIAPLSAHYLAKLAHGLCDDLLTSIVRAWPHSKPVLIVPVMHELMWAHPLTRCQLESLRSMHNYRWLLADGQAHADAMMNSTLRSGCSSLPDVSAVRIAAELCLSS